MRAAGRCPSLACPPTPGPTTRPYADQYARSGQALTGQALQVVGLTVRVGRRRCCFAQSAAFSGTARAKLGERVQQQRAAETATATARGAGDGDLLNPSAPVAEHAAD